MERVRLRLKFSSIGLGIFARCFALTVSVGLLPRVVLLVARWSDARTEYDAASALYLLTGILLWCELPLDFTIATWGVDRMRREYPKDLTGQAKVWVYLGIFHCVAGGCSLGLLFEGLLGRYPFESFQWPSLTIRTFLMPMMLSFVVYYCWRLEQFEKSLFHPRR